MDILFMKIYDTYMNTFYSQVDHRKVRETNTREEEEARMA
jgi:hypothetical protein